MNRRVIFTDFIEDSDFTNILPSEGEEKDTVNGFKSIINLCGVINRSKHDLLPIVTKKVEAAKKLLCTNLS